MNIVIIILGILFLIGLPVGKALAVCSIITGILLIIKAYMEEYEAQKKRRTKYENLSCKSVF